MRISTRFYILSCLAPIILAWGCSSDGAHSDGEPAPPPWAKNPARTVEGGYILYVGEGEDAQLEKSRFKAEAMALQDLANECSFIPKGARVEDHYEGSIGILHHSFAKVGVTFQDCEAAQNALTPSAVRELANVAMTEELKRYQDVVDAPEPEETADAEDEEGGGTRVANSTQYGGNGSGIHSTTEWVVLRQQVVYEKQDVILSPPETYAPQTPAAQQFTQTVQPQTNAIHGYQNLHPEVSPATTTASFSQLRPNAYAHQASSLRNDRFSQAQALRSRGNSNHNFNGGKYSQNKAPSQYSKGKWRGRGKKKYPY